MKGKLIFVMAVSALFFSLSAFADNRTKLFQVEVPVESQREAARSEAMRQGLQDILVRLTSHPDIAKEPAIQEALKKADSYVQSYSYRPAASGQSFKMTIQFDKEEVAQLLKGANIPFWGETRPAILVWLVMTDQHGDQIISADEPNIYMQNLKEQAEKYGMPFIFPVMDVAEMTAITPKDIIQDNAPNLNQAALRYHPDGSLIGVIREEGSVFKSHWKLQVGGKRWEFSYDNENPRMMATLLLNQISGTLSKEILQQPASGPQETQIHLRVTNVTRPEDFKRLTDFVNSISIVRQAELEQVTGDAVEFTLSVQGSLSGFQENMAIGKHLELKAENDTTNQLTYEWKN